MINGHTYDSNFSYESDIDTYDGTGLFRSRRRVSDEMSKRMRKLGPDASIQFLITVTAGFWLKGAVVHSGATHKYTAMPADQYPIKVSGVYRNGGELSLTEATSIANCVATAESFYFDSGNRTLYVNPPTGKSIHDDTYQAKLAFYFSRKPKNLRDVHWDGRLVSAPNLSLRIDARFTGVGQIGGGSASFANRDGFFDEIDEIQWDAGTLAMEIGVDYPDGSADMDEADYQKVGTWRIEKVGRSGGNFTVTLREPKTALENKIPNRTYNKTDFPNIADEHVGKPIPWAYGTLFGVSPICIDRAARKFKLADHPIKSIEGIRLKSSDGSGGWQVVNFQTRDLERAEFTLSAVDWADNQDVSVDLLGRRNADSSLMENPADVMADVLDRCGEVQLDSESFNLSRANYRIGTDRFGAEVTKLAPCIYLDSQRTGIDVCSEINSIAGSFLFVAHDGLWHYGAFKPVRASDLDPMAGTVIQQFSERDMLRDSVTKEVDNSKLASAVIVEYAYRRAEGWGQRTTPTKPDSGFLHGLPPLFIETKKVGLGKKTDADYWGQRYLTTEAQPMIKYAFALPWLGFFLMPGDKVKADHARLELNHVLEVLEAHYNFNTPPQVRFVFGNNRGWGDRHGWWSPRKAATPPRLGMVVWFKPEAHIYTEDQKVEIWRDASGNDIPITGVGDSGPTLKHQSANANGLPIAYMGKDFDGVDYNGHTFDFPFPDYINHFLINGVTVVNQGEIFAVLKPDAIASVPAGANAIWEFGPQFGSQPSFFPHSAGDIREGFGCTTAVTGISAANIVSGWNLYNVSRQTGNMVVRVNNVIAYNADPGGIVNWNTFPHLGSNTANRWFDGAFAEVIIYNRVLSSSERTTVVQYLSDKYRLGLLSLGATQAWNPAWTDAQVADARQNNGYWTEQSGGKETAMADITDRRSFEPSRWW